MYDMALRTFLTLFICTSFDGPRKSSIVPNFTDSLLNLREDLSAVVVSHPCRVNFMIC